MGSMHIYELSLVNRFRSPHHIDTQIIPVLKVVLSSPPNVLSDKLSLGKDISEVNTADIGGRGEERN